MEHKMLFCFANISAEMLLHIIGYNFCTEPHILAHFLQMLVPLRASKIICAKAALLCHQNVDEIDRCKLLHLLFKKEKIPFVVFFSDL
jgi:hypothetical protein